MAFDVGGDNREMDLEFGFGKANPSHASEAVGAFPGSEDFLDPAADGARRAVMRLQPFRREMATTFAQKLRCSARGFDRLFDRQGIIGAVGINLARLIRDDCGSDRDVGLVGRSGLDRADDAAVLVGGNVGLVAIRGRPRAGA